MRKPTVGIVGMGVVGKGIKKIFPWADGYDKEECEMQKVRQELASKQFVFVCVPTPALPDGGCDFSIVKYVLDWLNAGTIIIKSTVAVGVTEAMAKLTGKDICFSPEYQGATQHAHPDEPFIILGGERRVTARVAQLYQYAFDCRIRIVQTDSRTAELVKYMENCFLATKVVFCNEFYRIAQKLMVDYTELRELFLLDSRIHPSHTFVYANQPYYDSHCLNKDIKALIHIAKALGINGLMESVQAVNEQFKVDAGRFGRESLHVLK